MATSRKVGLGRNLRRLTNVSSETLRFTRLAHKEDRQATFVTPPVGRERISSALPQHQLFRLRPSLKPGRKKAMQLKHLDLTTSDVSSIAAFFERFFGFKRLFERGSGAFANSEQRRGFRPEFDEDEEKRRGRLPGNFPCWLLPRQSGWRAHQGRLVARRDPECRPQRVAALISIAPLPATLSRSAHRRSFDD
jgi:hypothetical protein